MKGIGRECGYSPLIALFLEHFEAPDMTSVENRRKRFVANRSRRGFYRVAWTNGREFGPERERRVRVAKGMYKGVKASRGRSEIDTAGEVWRFPPFRHNSRDYNS